MRPLKYILGSWICFLRGHKEEKETVVDGTVASTGKPNSYIVWYGKVVQVSCSRCGCFIRQEEFRSGEEK